VTSLSIPEAYTEHVPPAPLREHVECIWTRGTPSMPDEHHHVLPDGCIDLVFSYSTPAVGAPPSTALAVGTMTRPLVVGGREASAYVGVRFWPGRALPFVGVPAAELTDLRVEIADLWRERAANLAHVQGADIAALRSTLEALLVKRLAGADGVDRTVDAAVRAILRAGGNLSIGALAPALGVTRQHLARAFAMHVGVSPKVFARVARVRRVLSRARVAAAVDWATLALDAGYYDQAHLAGEVREFTGRTPTEWLAST
jgi:AraC-like DNA-binding protein